MSKHLWEIEHPYYCNLGNYYSRDEIYEWNSFDKFLSEDAYGDLDYNLLFRWDWIDNNNKENELQHDELHLFWMLQRKGLYQVSIIKVKKPEEQKVIEFLKPRWQYMKGLWKPFE